MARRPLPLPSFDELCAQIVALPHGITGEILEPGVLRTMSRPGPGHRRAAQRLFRDLGGIDRGGDGTGWWLEIEAEIRLLRTRLAVPDASGWRVDRVPERPSENPITTLPGWVCEVLSPTTVTVDRRQKLPLYVAAGIPFIWLVDPEAHLVEVYVPDGGHAKLVASAADDETPRLPPFEVEILRTPWWSDPPTGGP